MPEEAMARNGKVTVEDLFRRYAELLKRRALRYTSDPQLAEDIAQETFIRAIMFERDLVDRAEARNWLLRVSWHETVSQARRHRPTEPLAAASGLIAPDLEQGVLNREGDFLWALSDRYRRLLLLKYVAGFDYQEIADLEGTTVRAVATALRRARHALGRVQRRASQGWPIPALVVLSGRIRRWVDRWHEQLVVASVGVLTTVFGLAVALSVSAVLASDDSASRYDSATRIDALAPSATRADKLPPRRSQSQPSGSLREVTVTTPSLGVARMQARARTGPGDGNTRVVRIEDYESWLPVTPPSESEGRGSVVIECDSGETMRSACLVYDAAYPLVPPP